MNDALTRLHDRLEAVEIRCAHQDKAIADLNEVITAQWRQIDLLERKLLQLKEEMQAMVPPAQAEEPPPPHY